MPSTVRPSARASTAAASRCRRAGRASAFAAGLTASPDLQGGEGEERADDGDDPEPDGHLVLVEAAELVVVVERGAAEPALARGARLPAAPRGPPRAPKPRALPEDRQRLRHEEPAGHEARPLVVDRDGEHAEEAADRERAGVPHEDLR